jgi:uncharacterized protein YdaU (DUF1376 family)
MTTPLEAALTYAERGWLVLPLHAAVGGACTCGKPCSSPGKHPRTKNGLKDATTSREQVRKWWTLWPDSNVGILTGRKSGLLVIDVDDKNGAKGSESLAALAAPHKQPLDTYTVSTGNGKHLYFRYPECAVIKNTVGTLGSGLDVRSDNGYVVAPPSLHVNTRHYHVEADRPLAVLPEWLLALMTRNGKNKVERQKLSNRAGALADAPPVFAGERNDTMYKLGCALRGRHAMERADIERVLLQYNDSKCTPPLEVTEVLAVVESVCSHPAEMTTAKSGKRQEDNPLYWFQFNTRDWFSDQNKNLMTDYQTGWYIRLIAFAWQKGGFLPADTAKLAKLANASSKGKFKKECDLVLVEFEHVEVNGESMLKHTKMAARYAETLADWMKKKEAGEASKAARMARPIASNEATISQNSSPHSSTVQ